MRRFVCMVFVALALCGCDEGDIYPERGEAGGEGRKVVVDAVLEGVGGYPAGYSLVVAGFVGGSDYAEICKTIQSERLDGFEMGGVGADVDAVEICVINPIRKRVATLYVAEAMGGDVIRINVPDTIKADAYGVIQGTIFNSSCVSCHGGSNKAAAGLYLTEGKSRDAIVGVASTKSREGLMIVDAGNADESFIVRLLEGRTEDGEVRFEHSNIVTNKALLDYLKGWIDDL